LTDAPLDEVARLRAAADALEAQRAVLGDAVVEAGLGPLNERIAALESPVAEERKQVTTLFADLVGFTEMSERLDPEDVREVLDRYFALWTAAIEARGGVVEKFIGDAVMAVFGMRQAYEDDPERAVLAALEMVGSLADLNRALDSEGGPELAMRVGVNTGEVVIGAVGDRREEEWVAIGDPINVAARLQAAAPVNGILIAHSTFRHVRGVFDVQEVSPLDLKGKSDPVRAYVVERAKPRSFRSPTRGVEGVETSMVGREAELHRLQEAFHAAAEGEPGMVTVVADAGMGKSRLLEEFVAWLDLLPDEIVYVKGRARQGADGDAFSLLRDTIAFRFQILDTDPPPVLRDKLAAGFGEAGGPIASLGLDGDRSALIGHLLGFDLGPESLPVDLEPQAAREQGMAAFTEWVHQLAAGDPVVIVLDDIHWADDASLDLAASLVTEPVDARILVVCGARPTLHARRPSWQSGERRHRRVDLLPLSARDSRRLVVDILREVPDLPDDLRDTVAGTAEGNPFHVEELVKMLIEDGVVVKGTDSWSVAHDRLTTVRVPETLVGVLQARIDVLDPEEKSVLHRAAVIGRSFWDRAVSALGDGGDVAGPLTELRTRELVYGREMSSIADADEYVFKHAVLREVAYGSVLRRVRRDYHARAAAWLSAVVEATARADEFAALVAAHHDEAGQAGEAATWYLRAGRSAAGRYANTEALALLEKAEGLTDEDDLELRYEVAGTRQEIHGILGDRAAETEDLDALARLADRLADDRKRIDVALRRAEQATDTGRQADAEAHAQGAAEMARRLDDPELVARALLALGIARWHQGSPTEALPVLTEALDLAVSGGHETLAANAQHNRGVAHHLTGRWDEADADYRESARRWRLVSGRSGLSRVLNSTGILAFDRADYTTARSSFDQALAAKRAMGDLLGENRVLNNVALVALAQHDYDAATDAFARTLEIALQIDDLEGEASSHQGCGFIALRTGRFDEAEARLSESRRLFVEEGDQQGEAQVLEMLADLAEASGDTPKARSLAEQAVAAATAASLPTENAGALARLGHLSFGEGRFEEAEAAYRRALELHAELDNRGREVEAKAGFAVTLNALGREDEARSLVDEVVAHIRHTGAGGIEDPVDALLACRQVLDAQGDAAAAADVTDMAREHIEETSSRLGDPQVRRSYRENVATNRIIIGVEA
jgi:class 3 adenylate cyclase/tetratricopeptide (TPR) repeat protein